MFGSEDKYYRINERQNYKKRHWDWFEIRETKYNYKENNEVP